MNYKFNLDDTNMDVIQTAVDTYTSPKKSPKKHKVAKKIGVFVLSGTLFGVAAGGAFTGTSNYLNKSSQTANTSTIQDANSNGQTNATLTTSTKDSANVLSTTTSNATDGMSVADIANNCMPSIVAITNVGVTDVMTYWGKMQQESESCGSGVIIGKTDDELLIVTNYHVIEGNNTLTVVFSYDEDSDKPNAVEAYTKGYDADKDLAVIAIPVANLTDDELSKISVATVGNSTDLSLGEQVVAIGNALGYGQSVTTGIVSALNRTITSSSDSSNTSNTAETTNKYIQTDAAINPGNSGGALFNMAGELVGINSAKIASDGVEGMGYAIPISDVYDLIEKFMNETTRTQVVDEADRGYLGITGSDITSEISSAYGFPEGIYVTNVTSQSAADKASIVAGNIITKFDGKSVSSLRDLQKLLTYYLAGETVTMTIAVQEDSSFTEKEISVTLSSSDDAGISSSTTPDTNTMNRINGYWN